MKKILVLNMFPTVFPPRSGGTLRYYHLYHALSKYYDITLLSQTSKSQGEKVQYSPTFKEYKVEIDPLYRPIKKQLHQIKSKYEQGLIIQLKLSEQRTLYKQYYDHYFKRSDLIIHESPYLVGYDLDLKTDRKPRVYNSHNHEYVLAEQIWKDKEARAYLPILRNNEEYLVKYAKLVFATSEDEQNSFATMYASDRDKFKLAPNGIHPKELINLGSKKRSHAKPTALFIGSDFPPNIAAVRFMMSHLADQCANIQFVIAGGCCKSFENINKPNVSLLGRVSHKTKLKLFAEADLAINPMFEGAGVNLKTLEWLSAGIPLFSTSFGARGLKLINGTHYINAEKNDFAEKLNLYATNRRMLKEISRNAQKYINDNYSWRKIAKRMKKNIDAII